MIGYPKTIAEALKEWDAGGLLHSVEMGGLGPGYEQAIQVSVIEILRDAQRWNVDVDEPEAFKELAEQTLSRINDDVLGLSGAQFGAAVELAFRFHCKGWKKTIESSPKDRRIMISNRWPKVGAPC